MKANRLRIAVTAFALAFAFGGTAALPSTAEAGGGYSKKHQHHYKGHHGWHGKHHHHNGVKRHHAKPHKNDRIIVFRNGVKRSYHAPAFRTGKKNQRVVIINPNHDRKFTKRKRFKNRGFIGRSYYHGGRHGNRWHRRHGRRGFGSGTRIIIR